MSGSPKWSDIQLRDAQEQRLRRERERRALEERRRREAAERRARERQVQRLHAELQQRAEALRGALQRARAAGGGEAQAMGLPQLEADLDLVLGDLYDTPYVLHIALRRVDELRDRLEALEAQGEALRQRGEAQRRAAWAEVRAEAERLREQRTQAMLLAVNVSARVDGLRARLAGMEADEVVTAWVSEDLAAAREAVEGLTGAADPVAEAQRLDAALDAALERAQARQLAEERRAYIVEALQGALVEQGFQVSEAGLTGDSLDAEVCFRAARADQRRLDVFVPVEGSVIYELDSGDQVVERGPDGAAYTHCDDTEARLEALHADLAERFGVDAGELLWENKSPIRRQRTANALPTGGGRADRRQEG